ncbi:MAG TPA: NAD-dependent epimerase/dehydratase family protein [Longimicrobiales bacterium]
MTAIERGRGLVFMTGASGFIGGRLARALDARGYRLRCLVRAPERAAHLAMLGAELVVGDAADENVLRKGMASARYAIHLAGRYDLGLVDAAAMTRVNVTATNAFLAALRRTEVERALYTSTVMALGPARGAEGSEDDVHSGPFASVYERTKTEAHHLALAAQRDGAPLIIICPALVYGPGDNGPSGRYVRDVLRHRVPGLSRKPAWFSYVHVEDVAEGMVAALERGRIGATYVLSGEHVSANDYTKRIAKLGRTWGPALRVPPALVKAMGSMMDALGRRFGVRLPISRELAETAGTGARWVHSHARALAELGYRPRTLDEGLPETVRDAQAQIERG